DQNHRRRPQAALHRPTTQPSLVQDERRGLQPDPNRRPRRPTRLSNPTRASRRPDRARREPHEPLRNRRPQRGSTSTRNDQHTTADFPHPVNANEPPFYGSDSRTRRRAQKKQPVVGSPTGSTPRCWSRSERSSACGQRSTPSLVRI